jgi:hypothetical protein
LGSPCTPSKPLRKITPGFFVATTETPTLIPIIFLGNCPVSAQADWKPGEPVQALRYTTRGDGGRKV